MKTFIILALGVIAVVAGLATVFSFMHGKQKTLNALPDVPTAAQLPKYLESVTPAREPAQPPGASVHKCISAGRVVYTDLPCGRGQTQRALDPERSRIEVLPAERPAKATPSESLPLPTPDKNLATLP